MKIVARHYQDSRWTEIEFRDGLIANVAPIRGPERVDPDDDWVCPAFWDIQLNGRWGHSFSSPDLTVAQVAAIVRAQAELGVAKLCPTLITAPVDHLLHGLRTIASTCDHDDAIASRIVGVHLEGPFISEQEGYRGAHPAGSIQDPDWGLFEQLQRASGHRIAVITLAPERPGAIAFIRQAVGEGVTVALGHTAADGATIDAAIHAGATLSTHLGNGVASPLSRHPNPIWDQAGRDDLTSSFIADGHHVDLATLRVLARAKGPDRTILISDASPLAGLPVGSYGEWAVDPSGMIVVAGTPYLAGSNQSLEMGLTNLLRATAWPIDRLIATVTANPARALARTTPRLAEGEPADMVLFRVSSQQGFTLRACYSQSASSSPENEGRGLARPDPPRPIGERGEG
jgi:N-acetylglucosamine-6-phosphate deacetylase